MHSVALAAGKDADFLLLVRPGETELGAIGASVDSARAELQCFLAAADRVGSEVKRNFSSFLL